MIKNIYLIFTRFDYNIDKFRLFCFFFWISFSSLAFDADICHSSTINSWRNNDLASNELSEHSNNSQKQRQRRPDRAVYVPRGRRSQTTPPSASVSTNNSTTNQGPKNESPIANNLVPVQRSDTSTAPSFSPTKVIETQKEIVKNNNIKPHPNQNESLPTENFNSASNMSKKSDVKNGSSHNTSDKDYNEEKELQRASKVYPSIFILFHSTIPINFHMYLFFPVHLGNESSQSSNH